MIHQIERMADWFKELDFKVDTPKFQQTLSEEELIRLVPQYDAWIIGDDPATESVFKAGRSGHLRAAVKWGAGIDNVDIEGAKHQGIPISNTPGTFGEEVSDVAMGYLLGLCRGLFQIDRGVRSNLWPKPSGRSLNQKTVGVVGLGHIGKCLVRKLKAFGINIIGYDPFVSDEEVEEIKRASWPNDLESIDFLILCCNLTPQNIHLVNTKTLAKMKTGVTVINVSRGGLIDEVALAEYLDRGKVHAAALEVQAIEPLPLDSPLRNFEQVVFGSHNSSNTVEAVLNTSRIALDTLARELTSTYA